MLEEPRGRLYVQTDCVLLFCSSYLEAHAFVFFFIFSKTREAVSYRTARPHLGETAAGLCVFMAPLSPIRVTNPAVFCCICFARTQIASDWNKPDGQMCIGGDRAEVLRFLHDLPVRKVGGVASA